MAEFSCGIDFGTTNSSVALVEDGAVRVLPIDPNNDSATSLPSLLYITREGEEIVGRSAADTFIERNVDREVLVRAVELGVHIEGYVGGELDNEYGGSVRKDGDVFVYRNRCPHRGGPLARGVVQDGRVVRCPMHGWRFDLATGACKSSVGKSVKIRKRN